MLTRVWSLRLIVALVAAVNCAGLAVAADKTVASAPRPTAAAMADKMGLHQVEITFHQAASTRDVALMMSLFTPDAVLTAGGATYSGSAAIAGYFSNVAGSFKPANNWIAYTPTQRITTTVNGDSAELYFECLYMDVTTGQVGAHTYSKDTLVRAGDHWLIKSMDAGKVAAL